MYCQLSDIQKYTTEGNDTSVFYASTTSCSVSNCMIYLSYIYFTIANAVWYEISSRQRKERLTLPIRKDIQFSIVCIIWQLNNI